MELTSGILVKSKAGRDKDKIYVISFTDNENIYVTDGDKFPVGHEKRKNRKHLQPIMKRKMNVVTDTEEVKAYIESYIHSR